MKIFKSFIAPLVALMIATPTLAVTTAEQTSRVDSLLGSRGYYPTDNNDLHGVLDDSSSTRNTMYFFLINLMQSLGFAM